ncbi:MAG: helix-turn-helix domain-containing protein [Pseudomonadota bacterium]
MAASLSAQQRELLEWRGVSPKPRVARTSSDSEWQNAFFQETYFPGCGSFDVENSMLGISCLPDIRTRLSGRRHFLKPMRHLMFSLPGEGYRGEWEGRSSGAFLFVTPAAVEAFTGKAIKRLAPGSAVRTVGTFRAIESNQIEHIFRLLQSDVAASSPDGPMLGEQLILRILSHLFPADADRTRRQEQDVWVQRMSLAKEIIQQGFHDHLRLESIASACGITVRHLCRMFRAQTGMTPHGYIIRCRVDRAIELIRTGQMEFAEIANTVGFFDQAHMSTTFRRVTGCSPSHFRNT